MRGASNRVGRKRRERLCLARLRSLLVESDYPAAWATRSRNAAAEVRGGEAAERKGSQGISSVTGHDGRSIVPDRLCVLEGASSSRMWKMGKCAALMEWASSKRAVLQGSSNCPLPGVYSGYCGTPLCRGVRAEPMAAQTLAQRGSAPFRKPLNWVHSGGRLLHPMSCNSDLF